MKKLLKNALSALLSISSATLCVLSEPLYTSHIPEASAASMSIYLDGTQAVAGQDYQLKILVKNAVPIGKITNVSLSVPTPFTIKKVNTESPAFKGTVSGKVSGQSISLTITGSNSLGSSNVVAYIDLGLPSNASASRYMFQWVTNSPQMTDPLGNKIDCLFSGRSIEVLKAGSAVTTTATTKKATTTTKKTTTTTTTTKKTTTTTKKTTTTTKKATTTTTTKKATTTTTTKKITTTTSTTKKTTAPTTKAPAVTKYGDTNCDNVTDISDAVLILQFLANPEKYRISSQGIANADVCMRGDGLTALDALSVQKYEAGTITVLPESYKK